MNEPIPYTVVFRWPEMPSSGAGSISTVFKIDGKLPSTIVDPIEQNSGEPLLGTWRLDGTDESSRLAMYWLV
jgi:hypothetical protein